ncbi:uncharacterized protein PAC_12729 [Phialocephala subalpina]|uniref:Uncharacterized protein n=1 Tax=Phialocephala subalpina TaxID=576137 RepID=A0A1L7XCT3_9HELO|nr:uncharacterized protein PAC_12729 [Phialocephala subalpina]
MACYCANYYGSVNCHNTVSKFGDRCALCMSTQVTSSGATTNGYPQGNEQWADNIRREQMRREEEKTRRERVSRTTSGRIR